MKDSKAPDKFPFYLPTHFDYSAIKSPKDYLQLVLYKTNYSECKRLSLFLEYLDYVSKHQDSYKKPSLLLHACCAPCSSYVLEYLSNYFDITIYYYNPNIHPEEEYLRRLNELKKFLAEFPLSLQNRINLVVADYVPQDYFAATNVLEEKELQREPEKGVRCRRCYSFRMKKAYEYAALNSFDFFTTTLSISPHKSAEMINEIGLELDNLLFLPADFKKQNGYLRSLELSKEFGLYRQDYCGCVYSKENLR